MVRTVIGEPSPAMRRTSVQARAGVVAIRPAHSVATARRSMGVSLGMGSAI